jgi:hypothetical protein
MDQPLQATIAQFMGKKSSKPATAIRVAKETPKKAPPPTPESPVVQGGLGAITPSSSLEMTIDWSFAEMEWPMDAVRQWGN